MDIQNPSTQSKTSSGTNDGQKKRVLLTGASGFVGSRLFQEFKKRDDLEVICGSQSPELRQKEFPEQTWVEFNMEKPETFDSALRECHTAYYLVHAMSSSGEEFERVEERCATEFARAAHRNGVDRIIYLGGVAPQGTASKHLRSRLRTGQILRDLFQNTVEFRASMIIGAQSASWRILRDLSVRLPFMILPKWLDNRTQPIDIRDVVWALARAIDSPIESIRGIQGLPGPDTLSFREMIFRVAHLRGTKPITYTIPVLSPRLSSYWIQVITRSDKNLIRELVEGLQTNLLFEDEGFWKLEPTHPRKHFEESALWAFHQEAGDLSLSSRLAEKLVHRFFLKS